MQNLSKITITNIKVADKTYPERLRQLFDPPNSLNYLGARDISNLLTGPTVGIVGSRKVTPYGREVTSLFAAKLSKMGVCIISGLALGVDSIAHRTTLDNNGSTIAVLPSGLASIYPASHTTLANNILRSGGLVTEYSSREKPKKYYFIARNRIIAALSDVLLVTEAAERSGSLHTAGFAMDLGKTVFAVPGNINSPSSRGVNKLIQSGALPALDPNDILQELGIEHVPSITYMPANEVEDIIIKLIKKNSNSSDSLAEQTGISAVVLQQHLSLLEIKGVIGVSGGQWYII